ncbi:invasion associated locus B family protein [Daeguia caeni]|uniref:Invasion associated locus B family protein n=1 Tax=Daeguia caeni TaxID=439612 RepID=A0ABV9H6W3_9HYPH
MKKQSVYGLSFIVSALTVFGAQAAPLPGGASSLQETFQDWTVSCQSQKDATVCALQQVQGTKEGQRVLTVELRNVAGGKVEGVLLMPFGLDLAKGAQLKIDDASGPSLAFSTCLPQGCLAPVSFDAKQTAALKAGTTLNVAATALNPAQPVNFKVSLNGFGAALDRVTALTK